MGRKLIDLAGKTFGKWTVLSHSPHLSSASRHYWLARCSCGNEAQVRGDALKTGGSTSCMDCGLQALIAARSRACHGLSQTDEYGSWSAMNERCARLDDPNYGGRGIAVCAEWRSFERFLADMGPRPRGATLDRIDVNGNYEPDNCRWASAKTQGRNRRNTTIITALGRSAPLTEWAELTGLQSVTIRGRLRAGWSDEEAVTLPRYDRPHKSAPASAST